MSKSLKRKLTFRDSRKRDVMKPPVGIPRSIHGSLALTRYGTKVPELKFVDFTSNSNFASSATPPSAVPLLLCVQGTAPYNRIGQRIQLVSMRIRGQVAPIATTSASSFGRIIVVYDRQANGASPSWTDVISQYDQGGNLNSGVLAGLNMGNRERFIVLIDEQYTFSSQTITAGAVSSVFPLTATEKVPIMANFDRYVKLRGLETHFNQTNGGTIADIQTGAIHMFVAGDATSASAFKFTWWGRFRYQDL